ncbi:MAG: hypothetical protein IJS49_02125 [Paludibacteraceae bacterium]|nr:hypothetical protein [Paludibacteraceae bacterium]
MKKILSFILLALMCSIGNLWAVDPTLAINTSSQGSTDFLKAYATEGITLSSSASFSSGAVQLGNTPSSYDQHYFEVLASNDNIDSVSFLISGNGSNKSIQAPVFGWATTATGNTADTYQILDAVTVTANSYEAAQWFTYDFSNASVKCLRLYRTTKSISSTNPEYIGSSTALGSGQTVKVYGIKVWLQASSAPTITSDLDATADVQVGIAQEFSIVASGATSYKWYKNATNSTEGAVEIDGATSATYSYTAEATGTEYLYCVVTNAVGSTTSTICAVTATNPPAVTAASIAGPAAGYAGFELTYTATAENATDFEWYLDGVKQGSDSAKFIYTAVKGNHAIYCKATNDFTATPIQSNTINLSVTSVYGEIVTYTMETGSGNIDKDITAGGLVGATGHQKSQKNGKLGSNGHYLCFTLNQGYIFKAGDIVKISVTPEYNSDKQTYNAPGTLKLASDLANTDFIGEATLPVDPQSSATMLFEITLTKDVNTIYLSRNATFGQNPIVASVVVTRPAAVVSEAWESLTIDNGPTSYNRTGTVVNVVDAYLDPTVVVTKHVVYADATEANVDVEVTDLEVVGNQYVGHVTIGGDVYTINIAKLASYDVTYMDGEVVLGTEVVAANGHPAEFADYQNPQLATFGGWYRDANLTNQVANIASEIISANATYYAKYTKYYATSINIEQLVLDNSMKYGIIAQLGSLHYASNITGSLDSLDVKENGNRNYPYLGLKVKQSGALLNFRVAAGNTVKVKFGNIAKTPNVSINGGDYAEMTITNNVYTYEATADALISIKMMDGNAVVFKQIQIGATPELEVVSLPLILGANGYSTYAANHKFTVSGATVYKAAYNGSDAVILTEVVDAVVPANEGIILVGEEGAKIFTTESTAEASDFSGNKLVSVVAQVTDIPANSYVLSTNAGVTEFNPCDAELSKIPANKAYIIINGQNPAPAVRIIFAENGATDINELEGAEKAVKFIENGKLYIQKDGVVYDATGAKVK